MWRETLAACLPGNGYSSVVGDIIPMFRYVKYRYPISSPAGSTNGCASPWGPWRRKPPTPGLRVAAVVVVSGMLPLHMLKAWRTPVSGDPLAAHSLLPTLSVWWGARSPCRIITVLSPLILPPISSKWNLLCSLAAGASPYPRRRGQDLAHNELLGR